MFISRQALQLLILPAHTHNPIYISSDMYMLSQPIPLKTPPVYTTHYPLSTVLNRTSTILSINPTLPHLHPPCICTTPFSLSHTAYFYTLRAIFYIDILFNYIFVQITSSNYGLHNSMQLLECDTLYVYMVLVTS